MKRLPSQEKLQLRTFTISHHLPVESSCEPFRCILKLHCSRLRVYTPNIAVKPSTQGIGFTGKSWLAKMTTYL
jgi:hypothetical protein